MSDLDDKALDEIKALDDSFCDLIMEISANALVVYADVARKMLATNRALVEALREARAERDKAYADRDRYRELANKHGAEANRAEAQIAAVRALHKEVNGNATESGYCASCYELAEPDCFYPCPTIRALDGDGAQVKPDGE